MKAEKELRAFALAFPETHEDHPWGESAFKVKKKVFVFMGGDKSQWGLSVKLPHSGSVALMMPFAEPTHYGLGKAGWVSATFRSDEEPPVSMLKEWIEESYRAVAPSKLVAQMDMADTIPAAIKTSEKTTSERKTKTGIKTARPKAATKTRTSIRPARSKPDPGKTRSKVAARSKRRAPATE